MPISPQHSGVEEIGRFPVKNEKFNSDIEQLIINSKKLEQALRDPLTEVVKYYLNGEGHLSLKKELLQQMFLSVVAVSGAGLYAVPADAYACSAQSSLAGRLNYIISTCVPALVVLYNSTELFLAMRAAENIPSSLTDYLVSPHTYWQKIVENTIIALGSAISAFPLAAVSFIYPIPGLPTGVIILQSIIVEFDNTILHFLPIKLALRNALYRLPILPLEFIYKKIADCCLSAEQRQKNQLQQQIDQGYLAIKQRLVSHLEQSKSLLAIYGFKFNSSYLNYTNRAGGQIKELYQLEPSPLILLQKLLDLIHAMSPARPIASPSKINTVLRKLVYIPGALWVMSSCAGFLIAPVDELTELTGNPAIGASISAPSVYFLGVLLAFFGGNSLQNAYDYLTLWQSDAVKIPQEFKFYPKTSILLIIISLYLSIFSYAAGAELINDNFKGDLEFLRPAFLEFAKTGLAFLGFTAMLDFFCNVLRKFSQYGKDEDAETVVKLSAAFSQLSNSIQLMKSDKLLISLSDLEADRLKSILNIRESTDKDQLSEILANLQVALEEKVRLVKQELKNDNASQALYISLDNTLPSPVSPVSNLSSSSQTIRQGQGVRTKRVSSCRSQFTFDEESSPNVSRRVTRTNSVDIMTATTTNLTSPGLPHREVRDGNSALVKLKELQKERRAVNKLISTMYDIPTIDSTCDPETIPLLHPFWRRDSKDRYESFSIAPGTTSFSSPSL